jgi:hypothetical protein
MKKKATRSRKLTVKDLAGRKKRGVRGGATAPASSTPAKIPVGPPLSSKWIVPCV